MLADYHMHAVLCRHAQGTTKAYAAEAVRKGLAEICVTDHVPLDDQKFGPTMMRAEFPDYREMVARCRATAGLPVLFGIEADFWPEQEFMDLFQEWLPAQPFDLNTSGAIRPCQEI